MWGRVISSMTTILWINFVQGDGESCFHCHSNSPAVKWTFFPFLRKKGHFYIYVYGKSDNIFSHIKMVYHLFHCNNFLNILLSIMVYACILNLAVFQARKNKNCRWSPSVLLAKNIAATVRHSCVAELLPWCEVTQEKTDAGD